MARVSLKTAKGACAAAGNIILSYYFILSMFISLPVYIVKLKKLNNILRAYIDIGGSDLLTS